MSAMTIEAPYTIASLPTPLDGKDGRIQAAPVYGLRGSRKRKRHEVAVGIDGEGVNIYNVQSQNLVSSYAIPPQSYLCCPPCSVYCRATSTTAACRKTFIVTEGTSTGSKRRLVCFTEGTEGKRTGGTDFSSTMKSERELHDGEVVSLEVVAQVSGEQLSVLVNYKDGAISIVNGDLSKSHHENVTKRDGGDVVEYAKILELETARKGILKNREDVLALMDQSGAKLPGLPLLCRMVRSNEGRRLELYALRDQSQHSVQSTKAALQLLLEYGLPSRRKKVADSAEYELHAPTGTLYQLLHGRLNIFNLSGTVPKLVTELGGRTAPVTSFSRVSVSSVLTFRNDSVTLFETAYGSVQASSKLSVPSQSSVLGQKRKREEDVETPTQFHAIATFTDLGLVVGMSSHELTALQLNGSLQGNNRRRSGKTLLSDVMGRGKKEKTEKKAREWEEWTAKVEALIAAEDIEGLEKLVANDQHLGRQRKMIESPDTDDPEQLQNGDITIYQDLWPLPEVFEPQDIDRRKVLFILSKVFAPNDPNDGGLEVRIASLKLLEWLALIGFLSVAALRKAFDLVGTEFGAVLKPGNVMAAIKQIDDDFQFIRDLLLLPVRWDVGEVVEALRLLVQSFDVSPIEEPRLALPAPTLENGEADNDEASSHLEFESKAAENELELVMNALTTGVEIRSEALRAVITHLHSFPQKDVTSTMRAMMRHSEIIFFIHILRIELADGGWTSQYISAGAEDEQDALLNTVAGEEDVRPSDQAIRAIGVLLNCAVDSLGPSGWLVGQSSAALRTDELVEALKAEVSAGLESCYEANSLEALLKELERCGAEKAGARGLLDEFEEVDEEKAMLPMSFGPELPVFEGRDGKTKRRSKAAIGNEKSRSVGKYTFEKIRI